jgi:voltage-gated potassium channel
MAKVNVVDKRLNRFLKDPASVRRAMGVIVATTATVVVASGVLMRLIDHREYHTIWDGMWWAVQTVTTVGYGDVTPKYVSGRIVAVFVMLEGVAFLAIVTALITSTFVQRASQLRPVDEEAEPSTIASRFDELEARLDQIDESLQRILPR